MGDDRHMALAGYAGALKRQKWIVLAAILITTASAMYFSSRHAPALRGLVPGAAEPEPATHLGAGNSAADAQARFDATQAQVAQTLNVATLALTNHPIPGVTPHTMLRMSSVSANAASNILTVTSQSPNQRTARAIANGLATSFVAYSRRLDTVGIQQRSIALNRSDQTVDQADQRRKDGEHHCRGSTCAARGTRAKAAAVAATRAAPDRRRPGIRARDRRPPGGATAQQGRRPWRDSWPGDRTRNRVRSRGARYTSPIRR